LKTTSFDVTSKQTKEAIIMRITIIIDDDLVENAREITGQDEVSVILHDALTDMVSREAGRRLAALGGSQPDLKIPPRRRPKPKK
jgi:Arc/MetJ family transcription regulator